MGEQNSALKVALSHQTANADRLDSNEQAMNCSINRNFEELGATKNKLDDLHKRVLECETQTASVSDLKLKQTREKTELNGQVREQIDHIEVVLGDAIRNLSTEADVTRKNQNKLANELETMKAATLRHVALEDRLDGVERKFIEDLARCGAKCEHMQKQYHTTQASFVNDRTVLETEESVLKQRLGNVERVIGGLEGVYSKHLSEYAVEVETMKAAHVQDGMVNDRLDRVEKMLSDSAKSHGQLVATRSHLEQLSGRLTDCEAHGPVWGDLKKAHSGLALMSDRIDYVEQSLQEFRVLLTAQRISSPDLLRVRSEGFSSSPDLLRVRSEGFRDKASAVTAGHLADFRTDARISTEFGMSKSRNVSWARGRGHKELPYSP